MRRPSSEKVNHIIEELTQILEEYGALRGILFGSYARGDYNALSDLDLFIIKETEKNWFQRGDEFLQLVSDLPIVVEPHIYTPSEVEKMLKNGNRFLEQILNEGEVLYEQKRARS